MRMRNKIAIPDSLESELISMANTPFTVDQAFWLRGRLKLSPAPMKKTLSRPFAWSAARAENGNPGMVDGA